MVTSILRTREVDWRTRRWRLLWHFLYVFKPGKVLCVTVQPKAGRWEKQAYFAKPVYILRPSSLGLDGGCMQCTCPEGQMNPAHETSSFRSQTQLPRIANTEHPLSLSRILNYIWCFDFFFVCLVGSLIWGRRKRGRECFLSKKKFHPVFHSVDPNR